jgi:hypothetical protein
VPTPHHPKKTKQKKTPNPHRIQKLLHQLRSQGNASKEVGIKGMSSNKLGDKIQRASRTLHTEKNTCRKSRIFNQAFEKCGVAWQGSG